MQFHWTEKRAPAHEYLNLLDQLEMSFYAVLSYQIYTLVSDQWSQQSILILIRLGKQL